jgi:mono/diheme cytochrome c family protein
VEGRHYETLAIAVIAAVVFYAVLRQCWMPTEQAPGNEAVKRQRTAQGGGEQRFPSIGAEDSPETLYRYILHVIRYGSNRLHFPGGEMEGGYLSEEEAPKVACYVMELGGHRCPHPYPKDAAMFYTSVCGGCHGDDGKGLHGAYPDLTRPKLLGIEMMMKEEKR